MSGEMTKEEMEAMGFKEEKATLFTFYKVMDSIIPGRFNERIPDDASMIVAYQHQGQVIVPIYSMPDETEMHSCDWEGCGSLDHVVRFSVEAKYNPPKYTNALQVVMDWLKFDPYLDSSDIGMLIDYLEKKVEEQE